MNSDLFYLFKVIAATPFLLYACKVDLKERRVPNLLWKYMIVIFVPLIGIEFFMFKFNVITSLVSFFIVFVLSCALYYGGMYGGADAKALIVLAVVFPVYPKILFFPLINQGFGIFAFSVLSNSVIFSPIVILYVFLRNLKDGLKDGNPIYYITGYRVDAGNVPRFHNLLEYFDGKKIVRLMRGIEPNEKMLSDLKKAKKSGKVDKIWVTFQLPFLCFITLGFFISLLIGDILFEVILRLV
jgi:preflagellin peptidase FlaK